MTEEKLEKSIGSLASLDRIESYLRSIYRYIKLLDLEAPDILMNTEKNILSRRISALSHEELSVSYLMWPDFCKDKAASDALLDEQIDKDMEKFLSP